SSATASADRSGSHAMRPYTYQLAWLKCEPVQLVSLPTLDTPAMAEIEWPCNEPSTTFVMNEPSPSAKVSASKISSYIGPTYARCVSCPRYSLVICSSRTRGVCGMAPNNGEKGSRGWKSSGPFLTWTKALGSNCPSSGLNSSYASRMRSTGLLSEYTNARHITMPPWGATALANMLAPSAWLRL